MTSSNTIAGPYTYDKIDTHWLTSPGTEEVSVGIYRLVPTVNRKALKREPANIRIKGHPSRPDDVYFTAQMICDALNAGRTSIPDRRQTVTAVRKPEPLLTTQT